MPLFPQIFIANQTSVTDNGIVYTDGDVYITITDDSGNPANGNNIVVTVAYNDTGNIIDSNYTVPGQSLKIYSGILSRRLVSDTAPFDYRNFAVIYYSDPGTQPSDPNVCDALISSVTIAKKESTIGAADGQVTINASSSFGAIQYKIDSGSFQSTATFTGLKGGSHTAYITDSNGCSASLAFTMPVLRNLLVSDPSVDLGNGNISRWNAAFNPVVFTYHRKDIEVIGISQDTGSQRPYILVNAVVAGAKAGDLVYLNAGNYAGTYAIYRALNTAFIIDAPYITPTSQHGFVNINSLRPYYKILTKITYQDQLTGQQQTITAANRPNNTGLVKADFSNFLQSLLSPKDTSNYTQINYRDDNLSASYQVQYAESWEDGSINGYISDYISVTDPYYVVYAAKQLGQRYGGNLAAYVPFASVPDTTQLAQWLSDFGEPAFSVGYPFDIGFIYSEYLMGLDIYCEIVPLDINRVPLPGDSRANELLNEDGSWLLNQDNSKFVITGQVITDTSLPAELGLNRLLVNTAFPAGTYFFTVTLKYNDESGTAHPVTQTQTIRIDDAVDENSVYLRWIGLNGSWNYYRFVYNQEISLDVQNATIIKNFVADWENQQGIEEVISKDAGQKMKVMAEDLSVDDIKGLQSIKYSPKAQMLINKNPVKWQTVVINTATYAEYETLNGQAPFSITFNMPSINIQTQ